MATKKVRISKDLLPSLGMINNRYDVRYRIISEDRNRSSAWSPIYGLALADVIFSDTRFSSPAVSGDTIKNVSIGWVAPQGLSTTFYDVYIKTGLNVASISISNKIATIVFTSKHIFKSGDTVTITGVAGYSGTYTVSSSGVPPTTTTSYITFSIEAANLSETSYPDGRVFKYTANNGYTYNATVPSPFYQVAIDGTVYDFARILVQVPTEVKALDSKALLKESDEIAI